MATAPKPEPAGSESPVSIVAAYRDEMFERIEVEFVFTGRLVGGVPKDPKLVQGWLRKGMGVSDDEELRERTRQTLLETAGDDDEAREALTQAVSMDDLIAASERLASELQTQGFKRDEDGLPYIESRQIKAAIKENVNILFAKERWGKTGKGPKNYTAERVFCEPDRIVVGDADAVSVDLAVGHITGPRGPQSTIGYYEFVERPTIRFDLLQLLSLDGKREPSLDRDTWLRVLSLMELNGVGAMRSQGFGQFVVTRFDPISALKAVD